MLSVIAQRTCKYALQAINRRLAPLRSLPRQRYFAYGANMDPERLASKGLFVTGSRPARLSGFKIEITSPCEYVGKGWASISHDDKKDVFGVVHEVTAVELAILDILEWVPFSFHKRIEVEIAAIDGGAPFKAWVYVAKYPQPGLATTEGYKGLLVSSAEKLGLPAHYVDELRSLPTSTSFKLDPGFRLSNPGKRRWFANKLSRAYRVHDEWRERLCDFLP